MNAKSHKTAYFTVEFCCISDETLISEITQKVNYYVYKAVSWWLGWWGQKLNRL